VARAAVAELSSVDPDRRERAFAVLACVPEAGASALLEALEQPYRELAAEGLGRLRASSAVPDLLALLTHGEADARTAAAWALGEIKNPRAVEGLLSATTDESFPVREASTAALDKLGVSAVVFAIAALVQSLPPDARGQGPRDSLATEDPTGHPRSALTTEVAAADDAAHDVTKTVLAPLRAPPRPATAFDRLLDAAVRARTRQRRR
jgi:hypothetical protein